MCGITGFLDFSRQTAADEMHATIRSMSAALVHRGPDDGGIWVDPAAGVALGHRRLSIVDLSPAGHQPMVSACGRYVIVFNGEIYNHRDLRRELEEGPSCGLTRWRGHSDTEVVLSAFESWGIEGALKRLTGMFAIALWDRQDRVLHLLRDRIGEKPLYYGQVGTAFVFASELKSLRQVPGWTGGINRNALALFLRHSYIPAPHTIYEGVSKLTPGTSLAVPWHSAQQALPVAYWSARDAAERGLAEPFAGTGEEAVQQLETLLRNAVHEQMEADVPLGAFLSGGVDSSTIVALMQSQSTRPVRTFTIGFNENDYDEAVQAREVARHLGTDHTELYVNPSDALDVIPRLPFLYDEPFADPSQIPTFLIAKLTRSYVTVSLSGDGGDELFGGYNRYCWGPGIWSRTGWLPGTMKRALASCLLQFSPRAWDALLSTCAPLLPASCKQRTPGDKLHRLAEVLNVSDPLTMYHQLVSKWKEPERIVRQAVEPLTALTDMNRGLDSGDFAALMMYLDLVTYLPDDILVKLDRAAMGVSLETRVPFLDHRVVEFAWRVPLSMKIHAGRGKWILRQLLYKHVPRELIERPKTGFGVPLDSWLRGPLRDWAEPFLAERRLLDEGFFHPAPIVEKWREHLSGKHNWQYLLWNVLMFQSWLESVKRIS